MTKPRKLAAPMGASPVAELRRRYGLTQQQVADGIGVSVGYIRSLEMQSLRISAEDMRVIEECFERARGIAPRGVNVNAESAQPSCDENDR